MNIKELETIMAKYGVAIRAIPEMARDVFDVRHKDKYPDGRVQFLPEYKRDMLVVERRPEHGGQFIMEHGLKTMSGVSFKGKKYYASIEEAINDLLSMVEE